MARGFPGNLPEPFRFSAEPVTWVMKRLVRVRVVVSSPSSRKKSETLLTAKNLTKHYGDVVALDGVSFGVFDGITGILGENGAGKSTAIKIFLGLVQPTSGSAEALGQNASQSIAIRSRLGYMPEHDCLISGKPAALLVTCAGPIEGNCDAIQGIFSGFTDYAKLTTKSCFILPFCTTPEAIGVEGAELAGNLAKAITE